MSGFKRYLVAASVASLWWLAAAAPTWGSPAAGQLVPPPTSTTTTIRLFPTSTSTPPTTAHTTTSATKAATTTTTTAVPASTTTSTTFPPGLLAIANSVKRTPANSTARALAALQPLQQLGFTAQQAAILGLGQFPVAGPASYTDDWLEPRPGPIPRLHEGIDIVAASGTPLRAPVDGVLKYDFSDPTGYGVAALVTAPDRTYYLMGHLSATVTGLSTGSAVKQGQVVGFVGSTGDSTGPHCHFEIHPLGGGGIDAKPLLDHYLADALAAAPHLIDMVRASQTPPPPVAVSVPVTDNYPPGPQVVGALPVRLNTTGSGAPGPPYTLAGAGLAAIIGVLAWWATDRRRYNGGLAPAEVRPAP